MDNTPTQKPQSSNLYLVTFLATLFLLLFVSCAIVLRSYILRRRYQRRLDEAMAAGMLLAPRAQGSKRKRFGAKPRIYDTWLADGGNTWQTMTPLSAQPVFVKRKLKEGTKPPGQDDASPPDGVGQEMGQDAVTGPPIVTSPSSSPANTPRTRFWIPDSPPAQHSRSIFPWRRRTSANTSYLPTSTIVDTTTINKDNIAQTTGAAVPGGYKIRVEMLQVSVLISMPSASRSARKNATNQKIYDDDDDDDDDDEDETPPLADLAFGVVRVNYRHSKPNTPPQLIQPDSTPTLPATPTVFGPASHSPVPTPLHTSPVPTPVPTPGPERQAQFFQ